ncbi:hypothetical protein FNV43_RR23827 [Rhamnella rubrinervis]|uniref:Uncharacterized protein n=1 Tax=Rhamnella rubrinervis TaxID=2594499 RepID=A0A8K0DKL2_9ROSA|nr:hypothetical protein FNV43_RR23827 [Rhamnella rubrinervis]
MMGFGAHGNGGSYSTSSSSNLSALAPPFTVDRSVPKPVSSPLVDLTEPPYAAPLNSSPHNWVPNLSPSQMPKFLTNLPCVDGYKFERPRTIESSNTHLPPLNTVAPSAANAFSLGQCSDSVGTSFVEAKPYYPSYLSPAMHNDSPMVIPDQTTYDWSSTSNVATLDGSFHNDFTQRPSGSKYSSQWGGLWNGFNDWDQGKLQEVDGGAYSKETDVPVSSMYKNYVNQAHAPKSLNTCAEASHGINILGGPVSAGKLDDKSFLGPNSNLMPIDYSRSLFESLSGFPETHHESTSIEFLPNSRNCQVLFSTTTHEKKHLRQHDASPNNGTSISKSSPAAVIRPLSVGATSLTPSPALVKIVNIGSDAGTDLCRNNPSTVKENRSPLASEHKIFWDPNQLCMHLGRNNPIIWETPLTKNEDKLDSSDASNHMSKGKSGLQTLNPDEFNLDLNIIETINSIEDSSETIDHHNPSVDSPCWKGASLARFSPFEASGVAIPQQMKNLEACNSLNVQAKENFPFSRDNKVSSEKPSENIMYHESGCLENGLAFPKNICSVANSVFQEKTSDDTVKSSCHLDTRGGKEFQRSDDTDGHGSRSIGYSDFKHSPTTQHVVEDGLTSENIKGTLEHDSSHSHLPCHDVVENVYSVPVEDAAINLAKSNGGESTLTTDVQVLVDTLCSSSQLLLSHYKNGFCQLRQKDLEAVKSTINNLSMCLSNHVEKGIEKGILIQESTSSQKSVSGYLGGVNEVHMGVSVGLTHLAKTAGVNFHDVLDLPIDHQCNKHYVPGKKDEKITDSLPVRDNLDMVKEEKMTQDLKNVLGEKFYDEEDTQPQTLLYKNLWLEAEAALCSISCKARFNRMKTEMEKSEFHKSEDVCENTPVLKKLSRSEVSSIPNTVDVLSPEVEDCPTTEIQNSSIRSITCETDDVMARFQILKCRVDDSNSSSLVNLDEPSSSKVSPDPNKADRIPPEEQKTNGSLKSDVSIQESTFSGTDNHTNDFDAAVMDRFHILKSRVDNCSSATTGGQVPEGVNLGYVGKRNHWPVIGPRLEDRSSDVKMEPMLQHHTANGTEGQLKVKEFHLFVDDNPLIQSHSHGSNRPGNQLLAGWHDSLSLDWEHVMKEELSGKNR